MDDEPDTFEVCFDDAVNVRCQSRYTTHPGLLVGDWYIVHNVGASSMGMVISMTTWPDNRRFSVGHQDTGLAIVFGIEFREAQRIARALVDACLDIEQELADPDPDIKYIIDAIIGSALMDHYVFPIAGWSV